MTTPGEVPQITLAMRLLRACVENPDLVNRQPGFAEAVEKAKVLMDEVVDLFTEEQRDYILEQYARGSKHYRPQND